MKYHIVFDKDNINAINKVNELKQILSNDATYDEKDFNYLFIVGGDGSFLKFASQYINKDIKIIFINAGTLGFYSYVTDLKDLDINEIKDDRNYLNIDLIKINNQDTEWYAINDFSIYSNYAINLSVYINEILLENMKSNGLLIATPMGSTARNKSLKGPIVLPDTNVFILTEIEPIHNHYYQSLSSSIVLNNHHKINIKFDSYKKYDLIVDGVVYEKTLNKDEVSISHSKSKARFLIKTDAKSWSNKLNYAFIK